MYPLALHSAEVVVNHDRIVEWAVGICQDGSTASAIADAPEYHQFWGQTLEQEQR